MTIQQLQLDEIPEQSVIEYLKHHPDFFIRQEKLLASMEIPHNRGAAISLVERRLSVLRDENQQLQRKLENLIAIAQQNELVNQRIQRLAIILAGASGPDEFFNSLYDTLQNEFDTDTVTVRLFEHPTLSLAGRHEFVEYDAQVFALFKNLLESSQPICGRLLSGQANYLFPNEQIASAVLIPLGIPKPMGILAMGSRDVTRFHSAMATDLLKYMGQLVSQLIQSWLRR